MAVDIIIILVIVYVLAIGIAIGIGANDETLSTVVGTGKLSLNKILMIGVVCSIIGAVIFGGETSSTLGEKLLNPGLMITPILLAIISSTIFWLILSSLKSLPVSTTHAVVGSAIGVGVLAVFISVYPFYGINLGGGSPIMPEGIIKVLIGWVTSPIVGFVAAYLMHKGVSRVLHAKRFNLNGIERMEKVQNIFTWSLIVVIIFTCLTRAGNDVANSIGIVTGFTGLDGLLPPITVLLLISGIGMAVGLFVIGRRVVANVGSNIVSMAPSDAFSVQIAIMIALFIFTLLGMPISGTQVLIFAIIGSSKAKKVTPNKKEIKKIVISWVITIPVAAAVAIGFYFIFCWIPWGI